MEAVSAASSAARRESWDVAKVEGEVGGVEGDILLLVDLVWGEWQRGGGWEKGERETVCVFKIVGCQFAYMGGGWER